MKLQILVPQYNETEEIIKPLLDSIAIQQNVDFEKDIGVIIVNDGSDIHLSNEFLSKYPFKIEYYLNEHLGVSATRNACLDHAIADYIMFCDADDMFFSAGGVYNILREIVKGDFDYLISDFLEETVLPTEDKSHAYLVREANSIFVHGKVYRKQFLLDYNIKWNSQLTIHEDSYFNILCNLLSTNTKTINTPFYCWRWRETSVCRKDPLYSIKTFINLIDSNKALINSLLDRNKIDYAKIYVADMVYKTYFTLNKQEWLNPINQEFKNNTESYFKKYWEKYKIFFNATTQEEKNQIIKKLKIKLFDEQMFLESITFEDWIKHIENL